MSTRAIAITIIAFLALAAAVILVFMRENAQDGQPRQTAASPAGLHPGASPNAADGRTTSSSRPDGTAARVPADGPVASDAGVAANAAVASAAGAAAAQAILPPDEILPPGEGWKLQAPDPTTHPEAYSAQIAPPPFDRAAYEADGGAAYLGMAVPARCWDVAQPGPETASLRHEGAQAFSVRAGTPITLAAVTEPGMPVSWTSFGGGIFRGQGVAAVSAKADAQGLASATYLPTAGTVGRVLITAGSPVRAGTIQYLVTIVP